MNTHRHISSEQAATLVQSGQWIYETDLNDAIGKAAVQEHLRFDALGYAKTSPDIGELSDFFNEVVSFAATRLDSLQIQQRASKSEQFDLAIRIKKNVIYKVGATASEGSFKILAVILAVAGTTNLLGWVGLAAVGLTIRDFINTIVSGWEQLTDPLEMLAFETVFALHGALTVVNADALRAEDYQSALGHVWPTEEEIAAKCANTSPESLSHALHSLQRRRILALKDGRWSICF